MEHNNLDNTLWEDKDLANALFHKAAFEQFEDHVKEVPANYFDHQTATILKAVKNKNAPIIKIGLYSKIAIAASILTILATSYLYFQTKKNIDPSPVFVKIEEIPTADLEAYVNSNEFFIETDLQNSINEETAILSKINNNNQPNLDSNNINN